MYNILKIISRKSSSLAREAKIAEVNLVGRDYVCPRNLTPCEIKSLLWTALDLKHLSKEKFPSVKSTNVAVILDKSNINTQIPMKIAANLLGANTVTIIDQKWKYNNPFIDDFGRLLAINSDMIFCEIKEQKMIEQIADGANVPVVNIDSCSFSIIKTLADLMTIYEHYTRLKYLTVAWVGKQQSLFNTYLLIFPQMKINLKYCLVDSTKCEDSVIQEARKYSQAFNTEIHELWDTPETVNRAHVIATSAHDNPEFEISLEHVKEAAINWAFLHSLPRGLAEVRSDVIGHKNSLVWKSFDNLQWIYAALIMRFLCSYKHTISEPTFDSDVF